MPRFFFSRKFCKSRSVPYAIKEAIEDEFDRLQDNLKSKL